MKLCVIQSYLGMKYCALVREHHYFKAHLVLDRMIQHMLGAVLPGLILQVLCEMKIHMKAQRSDVVFVK